MTKESGDRHEIWNGRHEIWNAFGFEVARRFIRGRGRGGALNAGGSFGVMGLPANDFAQGAGSWMPEARLAVMLGLRREVLRELRGHPRLVAGRDWRRAPRARVDWSPQGRLHLMDILFLKLKKHQ
jgi:hypothetical protein